MSAVSELCRRHWRLLVFILGLIVIFWLLWLLRGALLPFMVGFILAYLLLPIIRWVEKRLPWAGRWPKFKQFKRVAIILIVYFVVLAIIGLGIFYSVTVIGESLASMAQDIPDLIPSGISAIADWIKGFPMLSSISIQEQIDSYSAKAGAALGDALLNLLTRSIGILQSSSEMILGFISLPIFLFFILKDWDNLRSGSQGMLPAWALSHTRNILAIIQNVTGRYIRGQLLLGLAVGIGVFIMLMVLRIDLALPLAAFAGVTELVPLIGHWLGGIAGVLITLAVAPEKVIWVIIGYAAIQLLENNLLAPKIQGRQMNINPALVIMLSILGAYLAGLLGFIIALPLTMTLVEIIKYLRKTAREGKIS